jgi:hypothetical protein
MTTFDKFYKWAYPSIPSRDKIFAKLLELKIDQDKGTVCYDCEYGPSSGSNICDGCKEAYTSEFKPKKVLKMITFQGDK